MIFNALDQFDIREYNRLTRGMDSRFQCLPWSFMAHCERIVFGVEYRNLSYFCFHLSNDANYRDCYEDLAMAMEGIFAEVDQADYKNLANNLSNLLIFLREPKARANDTEYLLANKKYWHKLLNSDAVLSEYEEYKKYL